MKRVVGWSGLLYLLCVTPRRVTMSAKRQKSYMSTKSSRAGNFRARQDRLNTGRALASVNSVAGARRQRAVRIGTPEKHQLDFPVDATAGGLWNNNAAIGDTGAAAVFFLPVIEQGSANNQRVGTKVTLDRVDLRLRVHLDDSTNVDNGSDIYRVILFGYKQSEASTTAADLLSAVYYGGTSEVGVLSPISSDALKRYKIIHDSLYEINTFGVGPDTSHTTSDVLKTLSLSYSLKHAMEFKTGSSSGAQSNVARGGVGVLLISDGGIVRCSMAGSLTFYDA